MLCLVVAGSVAQAQTASQKRKLDRQQREEVSHLTDMVDRVQNGGLPGGDAWLKWEGHYLKGPDDKTYVPFTLTIDEAPTGFESVGIYIKVVEPVGPTEGDPLTSDNLTGATPGELPVSVPEQQFAGAGVPTAGSAAANLVMLEAAMAKDGPERPAFEDVHFAEPRRVGDTDARRVQRALIIEPGTYDLYLAVREFGTDESVEGSPRGAVLERRVFIPNLAGDTLTTSSIILTDDVHMLDAPYSPKTRSSTPTPWAMSSSHRSRTSGSGRTRNSRSSSSSTTSRAGRVSPTCRFGIFFTRRP